VVVLTLSSPECKHPNYLLIHFVRAEALHTDELIRVLHFLLYLEALWILELEHTNVLVSVSQEDKVTVKRN
jgi:hypothetical protein